MNRFLWSFLKRLPCFRTQNRYNQAKLSIHDRTLKVAAVVESLEREMELLCLTGVEDQLQADVRPTLELLRNAGIKVGIEQQMENPGLYYNARRGGRCQACLFPPQIWMLTGDKLETATCIAKSSHLVSRNQDIHVFRPVRCFRFSALMELIHHTKHSYSHG